jgi:hypothetical protein
MQWSTREILETIGMLEMEHLDIRTLTLGISLRDCISSELDQTCHKVREKIVRSATRLVPIASALEMEYGIKIANRRVAVTPISLIGESCTPREYPALGRELDHAAADVGVDFIGGYSALVHKGYTAGDHEFLASIPDTLSSTERVCASVNVASSRAGINMDAIREMGDIIKETARRTADKQGIGCAKLVVYANAVDDNPFMAGAFHGIGEPEVVLNVGVSGPGVISYAVKKSANMDLGDLAELIKRTAFKVTRAGELIGREAARRLGVEFGIIDISLAPSPAAGDSVAEILEAMGLEKTGTHGSTAALALLTDAVKKGGAMASSYVGGMSGAFIPVSEDTGMSAGVAIGSLSIDKLEAMTSVCSVGLDMVIVPGTTTAETIAAIIADEIAIGVVNRKTTGVRIIPAPGKKEGEWVEFGGLLGSAPVMGLNRFSAAGFVSRGGRIPAPIQSLGN